MRSFSPHGDMLGRDSMVQLLSILSEKKVRLSILTLIQISEYYYVLRTAMFIAMTVVHLVDHCTSQMRRVGRTPPSWRLPIRVSGIAKGMKLRI